MREPSIDPKYCKKQVWPKTGWPRAHQCSRLAKEDGFCKTHHPDAEKKREDEREKQYSKSYELRRKQHLGPIAIALIKEIVANRFEDPSLHKCVKFLEDNQLD